MWYGHYFGTIKFVQKFRGPFTRDGLCHALSLRYFRCFRSTRKRVFWLCTFCFRSVTQLWIFDDVYSFSLLQHGWRGYDFVCRFTWSLSCCKRDWKAPSSSFFPDFEDDPGKSWWCMISWQVNCRWADNWIGRQLSSLSQSSLLCLRSVSYRQKQAFHLSTRSLDGSFLVNRIYCLHFSGILIHSSLIPFLYPSGWHTVPSKLVMYFLGFGPCFVKLSIRDEGLFYVAYSITLVHWIQVERIARLGSRRENGDTVNEKMANRNGEYSFQWDDVRTALFFLFFVQVGFFGTGK